MIPSTLEHGGLSAARVVAVCDMAGKVVRAEYERVRPKNQAEAELDTARTAVARVRALRDTLVALRRRASDALAAAPDAKIRVSEDEFAQIAWHWRRALCFQKRPPNYLPRLAPRGAASPDVFSGAQ